MNSNLLLIYLGLVLWTGLSIAAIIFLVSSRHRVRREADHREADLKAEAAEAAEEIRHLSRYRHIVDAEQEASRVRGAAQAAFDAARQAAAATTTAATQQAQAAVAAAIANASATVTTAATQAAGVIANAHQEAQQIAGDALKAQQNVEHYRREARALENVIAGYGTQYIVPTYSLLDDLAETFGFTEAGVRLKEARDCTRALIKAGKAATCEYVEANRRETAIAFVTDAFNGKVDSILSRVKEDNVGTLRQKIQDAFSLVNMNGRAFRDARVLDTYLQARLEELRWAAVAQELRNREKEEQRRIREQMREEEKARREYERAIKDAEKEEESIKKAMEKIRKEVAKASDEQRQRYETQLAELGQKLQAAEDKNRRALSMAQQTKTGHVYVISNLGSFGEEIFKIGLTRRLEPLDRVHELGDASVPFPFDVHAMILSEDAPALEHALHRHFLASQMNKTNTRKEFFRVPLQVIREEIDKLGIQASWTMTAAAAEYRQSLAIDKAIKADPASYQAWVNKQLVLDARAEAIEEGDMAEAS